MIHRQNDERYIEMGRQMCITTDLDAYSELERMNKGKVGRQYMYRVHDHDACHSEIRVQGGVPRV